MAKRIQWIDFGKGITMLMVVLGHVSLGLLNSNMFVEYKQLLTLLIEMVYVIHMPVFFALSDYFFKFASDKNAYFRMIFKKILTLGIPYVAFSIIMFLLKSIGGDTVRNPTSIMTLVNIYREPIDHLWFLYTLFGVFVYIGLLSIFIKNVDILLLISLIGYVLINTYPTDIFLIQRVLTWSPVFVLGLKLRNASLSKNVAVISCLFYILYLIYWKMTNSTTQISYNQPGIWGIIFPFTVIMAFAVFSIMKDNNVFFDYFVKYGKISLSIYMLHEPIASVVRIAMFKVGITNFYIQWLVGIIFAWYLSIIIYNLMHRISFLDFFLYPLKYLKTT